MFLACAHEARADSSFFEDKTIRLVLGFSPGGISDLWARALGRAMTPHIPGKPNIIMQNMPGAGSLTAANYIYGVAKPDGLKMSTSARRSMTALSSCARCICARSKK